MVSNKMIVTFMLIAATALAAAGCSDDNPVTTQNIDTAPLAAPTGLKVDLVQGEAILDWNPSNDHRTVNYFVTRERNGVSIRLGKADVPETEFVDENPVAGTSYYHVYATGNGGQESATVSASLTITLGHRTANLDR